MTRDEIRTIVCTVLGRVAPDADLAALDPRADLREALDLDSMDFLRFLLGLHEALAVEIAEPDYAKFATLDGCVERLVEATKRA